jgi:thymidylate synthase
MLVSNELGGGRIDGEQAWRECLKRILADGGEVAPRDQSTLEVLHVNHIRCDMARAVVTSPARKLNYRFMAAEALWVLAGDNRLEPLTRYVKRMAQFSDDGVTLAGAYGPPVVDQLSYVVRTLLADRATRQAVLTLWRPRPMPSKDIPCTVAMTFNIRAGELHQHVFMRSSDAWLGVPYDLFTFACVGLKVACEVNRLSQSALGNRVVPGVLTVTPSSSHLYLRDLESAKQVLGAGIGPTVSSVDLDAVVEGGTRSTLRWSSSATTRTSSRWA